MGPKDSHRPQIADALAYASPLSNPSPCSSLPNHIDTSAGQKKEGDTKPQQTTVFINEFARPLASTRANERCNAPPSRLAAQGPVRNGGGAGSSRIFSARRCRPFDGVVASGRSQSRLVRCRAHGMKAVSGRREPRRRNINTSPSVLAIDAPGSLMSGICRRTHTRRPLSPSRLPRLGGGQDLAHENETASRVVTIIHVFSLLLCVCGGCMWVGGV